MKYCKLKPRDAPTPQAQVQPQQEHPQMEDYKKLLAFYEKYHQLIEELRNNRVLP